MSNKYQDIIDDMTLEEKARLCTGRDMWSTYALDRLHIPSMVMSDGPHGLRKQEGEDKDAIEFISGAPATCFPPAATVACSWDIALGEEIGRALGEEAIDAGVNMLLGPGLNIKRSPLCGRNFEYYSEDPYLSGKMAAAYVRGIQSQGVAACIKHFAANNQEYRRMCTNSVVDERTLREIYLTGFEIAVKEGSPLGIMSSYNEVCGTYAFENRHLITDILRGEWGFKGCVISDWGACNDIVSSLIAGGNLEMPGCGDVTAREIVEAVESGELSERILDERVSELIDTVLWTNEFKNYRATYSDYDLHLSLARRAATESIVLLRNDGQLLPLDKTSKVAIIGSLADTMRIQGGGSSIVTPRGEVKSVVDIVGEYDINYIGFAEGYDLGGKINISKEERACKLAETADIVLLFVGLDDYTESEGFDRDSLDLPDNQTSLIGKVCKACDNVIVVLAGGSPIAMPWISRIKGLLHAYLTGQEGAGAILDILTGKANPSGKLAETYPLKLSDTPCANYYPSSDRNALYKEGLYVGYRYYDSVDREILFPFGYGLSYTTFQYSNLRIDGDRVSWDITNTGDMAGAEVAQLYIGRDGGSVYRPRKELRGFDKVYLEPGETATVSFELSDMAYRYYDVAAGSWIVEPGVYDIYAASSVSDTRLKGQIVKGPCEEAIPKYYSGDVTDISDEEYEYLYGGNIGGLDDTFTRNSPVSSLAESKSLVGRAVVAVLESKYRHAKGDINKKATLAGVLDMPIRGLAKLSGGKIDAEMVDAIVDMARGSKVRSLRRLLDAKKRARGSSK